MSYPPPNQPGYPPAPYGQPQSQPQPGGNYYPPPYPQPAGYPPPAVGYAPHHQQQPVVTQQPLPSHQGQYGPPADGWMALPAQVPVNVPSGLQYLTTIDQLMVKQKVELLEAFIGFETNNKYTIKNNQGQKVFYAVEDNDCCTRLCCGAMRSFDIKILDNYKNEVIHIRRDLACSSCWFPCCLQKLQVFSPPGNLVGSVEQTWSICTPEFDVKNESGSTVLKIEGPICRYGICGDVEFKVLSLDKSAVVGRISKQWSGLMREAFTDADYFGISFPLDLDVRMKAVMIGACFLIDFMYFEKTANEEHDGIGLC
ncbi:phospholipid scramblase 1 [Planococcus citri]|uniref:phospholipid scramblase 1 n=1 Tax=Planococcus citri TaxID=170843 RepID=UPI0031F7A879